MPDFFAPSEPYDLSRFPPSTDEDQKKFQEFFGGPANPERVLPMVHKIALALKEGGAAKIGAYGYCWGACRRAPLLVAHCAGGRRQDHDTQRRHGRLCRRRGAAPRHAERSRRRRAQGPHRRLPQQGRARRRGVHPRPARRCPLLTVVQYEKLLKAISSKPFASKNSYKLYDTMHHGWAAARADLSDAENKAQYEDVYKRLAGFFSELF